MPSSSRNQKLRLLKELSAKKDHLTAIARNENGEVDATQFMTSTLIEQKFTHNTIMRVMIIFFSIVFFIPAFIATTYKPFASEHEPFLLMF